MYNYKNGKFPVIALAGSSGAGKTTLAKHIAETYGLKFQEQSAGLILTKTDKEYLRDTYNYQGSGQIDVYRKSVENPNFGLDFQTFLLNNRGRNLMLGEASVMDRSPLDIMAFTLFQVSHGAPTGDVKKIMDKAIDLLLKHVDIIIYVPQQAPEIEDDGSRNSHIYFQKAVDAQFHYLMDKVLSEMVNEKNQRDDTEDTILGSFIPEWDWDKRVKFVENLMFEVFQMVPLAKKEANGQDSSTVQEGAE